MAKAKKVVGLDCDADAADGVRKVLLARLEELLEYRAAALDANDIEGVHDMRVASRRLRSASRDFAPYLGREKMSAAIKNVKRVADALGVVRDQDVALDLLERLKKDAPKETRAGIEDFMRESRAKRNEGRGLLADVVSEDGLASLRAEFIEALETSLSDAVKKSGSKEGASDLSFRRLGREAVFSRLEELRKRSRKLYNPFKVSRLHRIRISAKRLRYALELFASCWGERIKDYSKEVAKLQSSLGDMHDCDERIVSLGELLKEGSADDSRRAAAIWMLSRLTEERTKSYCDALARWREWETSGFESRLREAISAEGETPRQTEESARRTKAKASKSSNRSKRSSSSGKKAAGSKARKNSGKAGVKKATKS